MHIQAEHNPNCTHSESKIKRRLRIIQVGITQIEKDTRREDKEGEIGDSARQTH